MRVLIMAAGSSERWQRSIPGNKGITTQKLLAQLPGNETVLGRQLRQFRERDLEPTVISRNEDLKASLPSAQFFSPSTDSSLAATILSSSILWRGDMLLTFGDVVFSQEAFNKICEPVKGLRVYGFAGDKKRWSEIYAWRFGEENFELLKQVLREQIKAIEMKEKPISTHPICDRIVKALKVWHLSAEYWTSINDWTFDVDFCETYKVVCSCIEVAENKHEEGIKQWNY